MAKILIICPLNAKKPNSNSNKTRISARHCPHPPPPPTTMPNRRALPIPHFMPQMAVAKANNNLACNPPIYTATI
jgi:hypothetical protein